MYFANKDDIANYFSGDRIECLICHKSFKALAPHIKAAHGINVDQYKAKFGLPWSKGLCGCKTADKLRDKAETLRAEGKILTGIVSLEHSKKVHKRGPRRITPLHSKDRRDFLTEIGKQNRYSVLDFDECWRLSNSGLTQKEIGKKFGVSQMTVSRFMRKANKFQPK